MLSRSAKTATTAFAVLAAFSRLPEAQTFVFSYSAPVSCDDLSISWTGGSPPFELIITPAFGTPRRHQIPNGNWDESSGKGSFSVTLDMRPASDPEPDNFLLTMSDSTGFGQGGTSELLTANDNPFGKSCNLTDPGVEFNFILLDNLQQCRNFRIADFDRAVQPAVIYGLIPLGTPFELRPELGTTDFTWLVNVRGGTNLILFMEDAQGRPGGASDLLRVGNSDENTCINDQSPHSTIDGQPSQSSTTTTSSSSGTSAAISEPPVPPPPSDSSPQGAVIGGVIAGAIVFMVAIGTLIVFLVKRRRKRDDGSPFYGSKRTTHRLNSMDLAADASAPALYPPAHDDYHSVPFVFPPQSANSAPPSEYQQYNITPYSPWRGTQAPSSHNGDDAATTISNQQSAPYQPAHSTRSGSISSKAAMAGFSSNGYGPAPRFVLHTDAGSMDDVRDTGEDVVELPPTYTDISERKGSSTSVQELPPTSPSSSHPLAPTSGRGVSSPPTLPYLPYQTPSGSGLPR